MKLSMYCRSALAFALVIGCSVAWAQNVKITPVGTHPGELCHRDRATIFEDPTGVRLLYDPGQSVTGADDPRLGDIHAVLLSHAHGDHIGNLKLKSVGAGTCLKPTMVSAAPNSTTAEIAAAKGAALMMTVSMAGFIGKKIQTITGKKVGVCPSEGGATTVPVASPCRSNTRLGGTHRLKAKGADKAVEITIVFASHANNVSNSLLSEPLKTQLTELGAGLDLGPPTGYIVKFTNGLTVYLTGDTGIHTEMKSVIHDFHNAKLTLFNFGPNAMTGSSAAYAINELIQPVSVILTHPNEAVTEHGKLRLETRTAALIKLIQDRPVYLAISGRTMEFNGNAECVAGCDL